MIQWKKLSTREQPLAPFQNDCPAGLLAFIRCSLSTALNVTLWAAVACAEPLQMDNSRNEYQHGQGVEQRFGSQFMSGYFTQEGSRCFVTLLIQSFAPEAAQDATPLSVVRLRLVMAPGQIAGLDSAEKRSLNLTCGEAGRLLTIDAGPRAPLVAQQREGLATEPALSR